jgi:hypothetical protein
LGSAGVRFDVAGASADRRAGLCRGCDLSYEATRLAIERRVGPQVRLMLVIEPVEQVLWPDGFDERWRGLVWEGYGPLRAAEQMPARADCAFPAYVDRDEATGAIRWGMELWEQRAATGGGSFLCLWWRPESGYQPLSLRPRPDGGWPDNKRVRIAEAFLGLLRERQMPRKPAGSGRFPDAATFKGVVIPIVQARLRCGKPTSAEAVAKEMGISGVYLHQLVKEFTGMTWQSYVKTVPRPVTARRVT